MTIETGPKVGVVTPETLLSEDGMTFLRGMINGRYPVAPYAATMGIELIEVEEGRVIFVGKPSNPI